MIAPSVRLGVMLRRRNYLRRWQRDALAAVLELPFAKLSLLIVDGRPDNQRPPALDRTGGSLWRTYYRQVVERRCRALEWTAAGDLCRDVTELIPTVKVRDRWSEHFAPADIDAVAELRLDVLIRFGFGILRGPILDVARWGIWSYHFGDPAKYRGGPPGFWELVDKSPETGITLQRLTPVLDAGVILGQRSIVTNQVSYVRQMDAMAAAAVPLLQDVMVNQWRGAGSDTPTHACTAAPLIRHAPTNLQLLQAAAAVVARRATSLR